ncbi:ATP-binding protein [Planococcus shenhongbingii]|uniref:ATP-binding protein n=1 Tax=Planococcus shenhongbingii TaxID=3058398 RepID=A0ABT8NCG3_9BACL|nr:ATP-binding protein [Planococcus sp. N017]MDN7245574.1 ATP-binding protein [Planococcus sp. N017]
MEDNSKQVSNPFSTGSGGGSFEIRVQASFAVSMLTKSPVPLFPGATIEKMKLQGRYAGYLTDDFIIYAKDNTKAEERKILAQIKHTISITKNNSVFCEVIQAAWNDFNNKDLFNKETDAIALITGPLSAVEINNTRTLLEWARYSENEIEFMKKVSMKNFSNKEKKEKLEAFRKNINKANMNRLISDKQLWEFMKCFYLLGYDLDTENGSTATLINALITKASTKNPLHVWTKVINFVQSVNQNAGTITLENIPKEIKADFGFSWTENISRDMKKLKDHSDYIIGSINTTIGGVRINRDNLLEELIEMSESYKFILLTGERGSGKSSILKEFSNTMKERVPIFSFRAEDFEGTHIDKMLSSMGLNSTLSDLEEHFSLIPKKYIFIESLEKVLEFENTGAFVDLIQFIKKTGDWTIVASGRQYAYQSIVFNFLQTAQMPVHSLIVEEFKEEQLNYLAEQLDSLKPLMTNESIKKLILKPFFADLAYRVTQTGTEFTDEDGEREFQDAVWRDVISKEQERNNGMPVIRRNTFIEIAVKRAKNMVFGLPDNNFNTEAIFKLETDNLIVRNNKTNLINLSHDVLEDWALVKYIENEYQNSFEDVYKFIDCIGREPAINRAFRLWIQQKMSFGEDITDIVLRIIKDKNIEKCWQDEAITAILLSDKPNEFLDKLKSALFKDEERLFKRFCFILRTSCKTPDQFFLTNKDSNANLKNHLHLKPYGNGWEAFIQFIFENRMLFSKKTLYKIIEILEEWTSKLHIDQELPLEAKEAGLLALYILEEIKDSYSHDKEIKKILILIIRVIPAIEKEFNTFLDLYIYKSTNKKPRFKDDFLEVSLGGIETALLAKFAPDHLIKLAYENWFISEEDKSSNRRFSNFPNPLDSDEDFGLSRHTTSRFFRTASGLRGPFSYLLKYHFKKGLDFLIDVINIAILNYVKSLSKNSSILTNQSESEMKKIKIYLTDGTEKEQYSSYEFWTAYREFSNVPEIIQSALMALENWLIVYIEQSEKKESFKILFNYIFKQSNSVALTAVLTSLSVGYPNKFGEFSLPFISIKEFYEYEMYRIMREEEIINWHNPFLNIDPLEPMYLRERRESNIRPWRKKSIVDLFNYLQHSEHKEKIFELIDEKNIESEADKSIISIFNKLDIRSQSTEIIEVNEKNRDLDSESVKEEPSRVEVYEEDEIHNRFSFIKLWAEDLLEKKSTRKPTFLETQGIYGEIKYLMERRKTNEDFLLSYNGTLMKAVVILMKECKANLTEEEIAFCIDFITSNILQKNNNYYEYDDVSDLRGLSIAASILPLLLNDVKGEEQNFIKKVISTAVTHSNKSIRAAAAKGIQYYLWDIDFKFAESCMFGSIEYARLLKELIQNKKYGEAISEVNEIEWQTSLNELRESFFKEHIVNQVNSISFETHNPVALLNACLMIPYGSKDSVHVLLFVRILNLLERVEEQDNKDQYNLKNDIGYEFSMLFSKVFASFCLEASKESLSVFVSHLLRTCEKAPKLALNILLSIEYISELKGNKSFYWYIWGELSAKVREIADSQIDNEFNDEISKNKVSLVRYMLHVDMPWQKSDFENQDIILGKDLIIEFVKSAKANPDIFEAFTSLLYHFPLIFAKEGLEVLSEKQEEVQSTILLSKENTVFYLENVLKRYLFEEERKTFSRKTYYVCSILLDVLVETGSSKGYYLREYFISSIKIQNT